MYLSFRKDGRVTLVQRRPKAGCGCGTVLTCLLVLFMLAYVAGVSEKCSSDKHEKAPVPAQSTKSQKKKKTKKKQPEPLCVGCVVHGAGAAHAFDIPGKVDTYIGKGGYGTPEGQEFADACVRFGSAVRVYTSVQYRVMQIDGERVQIRELNQDACWWTAAEWVKREE